MSTSVTTQQASLYNRLGGEEGIRSMADDILDKNAHNPKIGHYFENIDMDQLKQRVFEFFSMGTGGPHTYTGKDMVAAHQGLNISSKDFEIANEDTIEVMQAHGYDQALIDEVVSVLNSMRDEVIAK